MLQAELARCVTASNVLLSLYVKKGIAAVTSPGAPKHNLCVRLELMVDANMWSVCTPAHRHALHCAVRQSDLVLSSLFQRWDHAVQVARPIPIMFSPKPMPVHMIGTRDSFTHELLFTVEVGVRPDGSQRTRKRYYFKPGESSAKYASWRLGCPPGHVDGS